MSIEDCISTRVGILVFGDGAKEIIALFFKKIFPAVSEMTAGKNPLTIVPSCYAAKNKCIGCIEINGISTDVWLVKSSLLNNTTITIAEMAHAAEYYKSIVEKLHIVSSILIDHYKALAKESLVKTLNEKINTSNLSKPVPVSVIVIYGHYKCGSSDLDTPEQAADNAVNTYKKEVENIHAESLSANASLIECLNILTYQPSNHFEVRKKTIKAEIDKAKEALNNDFLMKTFFRDKDIHSPDDIKKQIDKWPALKKVVPDFLTADYKNHFQMFVGKQDCRDDIRKYLLNLLTY